MKTDIQFLLKIGTALQSLGMDAFRLESALHFMASKLKIKADFFCMPTSLMVAINHEDHQEHFLKRTDPGEIHLEKLAIINDIGNQVCANKLSTAEALRQLESLDSQKNRYSNPVIILSFALTAAFVCIFIGSNITSALASFFIGGVVGSLTIYKQSLHIQQIFEAIAAFLASLFAQYLCYFFSDIQSTNVILASILMIIPGMTLTIAITELASQQLVAGTARLMHAFMIFLKIGFGVALAVKIFSLGGLQLSPTDFLGYHFGFRYLALILAALIMSVLFMSQPRDVFWISLSCFVGYICSHFGQQYFGSYLGLMLGGCSVAVGSNLFTRILNRPILITLLPGILVLVPGALGFQSLNYLYQHDLLLGIGTAFKTFAMALSLVSGIFIGNLLLRTKQHF